MAEVVIDSGVRAPMTGMIQTRTVETGPVRVRWRKCAAVTVAERNRIVCGACGDWQVDVTEGEEMLLRRVEIETEAAGVH